MYSKRVIMNSLEIINNMFLEIYDINRKRKISQGIFNVLYDIPEEVKPITPIHKISDWSLFGGKLTKEEEILFNEIIKC